MNQIPITLLLITTIIAIIYSTTISITKQTTENWGHFAIENFTGENSQKHKKKPPTHAVLSV
jgi:hypothetical protein